jgi:hypothetical protein
MNGMYPFQSPVQESGNNLLSFYFERRRETKKMLNKKYMGTFIFAVAFVALIMLVGNLAYAQMAKERKGPELPEITALPMPMCPTCKNVPAKHTKGKVTAPVVMDCPDCKKEMVEFGVYHCDKCEKEFLACLMCQRFTKAEAKCPKCEKVLSRRIKGKVEAPVKWKMKCPHCKGKPQEWLIQHCDECGVDFLVCPLCKKEQIEAEK